MTVKDTSRGSRPPGGAQVSVTDGQLHVWTAGSVTDATRAHLPGEFTAAHALRLMDGAGVSGAVLIPPVWAGGRNDYCLSVAEAHPARFRVMGRVPFDRAAGEPELRRLRDHPYALGVRLSFTGRSAGALSDDRLEWLWRSAEALDIPIMVFCPGRVPELGALAVRHPGLRLVIDHVGVPSHASRHEVERAFADVVELSRLSNVAVKASAVPCASAEGYPFADLRDLLRAVYEGFGPERVFWGSDVTRLPCSYEETVRHFTDSLDFISRAHLPTVMARGLRGWLKWT